MEPGCCWSPCCHFKVGFFLLSSLQKRLKAGSREMCKNLQIQPILSHSWEPTWLQLWKFLGGERGVLLVSFCGGE